MASPLGATLRYSLLRLVLFLASAAVLSAVGMRGFLLWATALLLSGALALIWLRRERDEMSLGISRLISRVNRKFDEASAKEDE